MLREQDALLLPCPLLNIKDVDFDDGSCEASICPQWTPISSPSRAALPRYARYGDCYWHERERRHAEMKRKREGGK